MTIVINYLKKRKKVVRMNIYFSRLMISDFKRQKYKRELQEINRALFILSNISTD